ncbi:MAG: NADPH:quinone reductase [Deltaproteobacteria bacterium]|nr:MAG: NADPH:quinone reductase [Deltaproteobacteria bacterium]
MKAIVVRAFGPPEAMRLEEVQNPVPGPGQVLVRVRAAGVNPVETYIRSGTYSRAPALPYTPGNDAGGVVEAVGDGVRGVKPGDRVYTSGTITGAYAELALSETPMVHPLPANASFAQGAALGVPYATAWRALFQRARAVPGETVLVHGASGGVGVAALQIARAAGLRVVGTAGTSEGIGLVAREGAHHVFDHRESGYIERAMEVTGGRGFDVILEMLANVNLARDLKILAMGGRVVVIGSRGTAEIDPRDTMGRDASILGMSLFNMPAADRRTVHAALGAGLSNGTLRPVVARELPLSSAAESHVAVMSPGARGKIVLVP